MSGPAALQEVFRERGLPEHLRGDDGSTFASTGTGRLSKLAAWWLKLGLGSERIHPGKTQQDGHHERMRRVLNGETARPPLAAGVLRLLARRLQPSASARGTGATDACQRPCPFASGVSGTGAGSGILAALGAATGAPRRFAEVPRAAAAPQRGPGWGSGRNGRGREGTAAGLVLRIQGGRAGLRPWEVLGRRLRRSPPSGHPSRHGGL